MSSHTDANDSLPDDLSTGQDGPKPADIPIRTKKEFSLNASEEAPLEANAQIPIRTETGTGE